MSTTHKPLKFGTIYKRHEFLTGEVTYFMLVQSIEQAPVLIALHNGNRLSDTQTIKEQLAELNEVSPPISIGTWHEAFK